MKLIKLDHPKAHVSPLALPYQTYIYTHVCVMRHREFKKVRAHRKIIPSIEIQ